MTAVLVIISFTSNEQIRSFSAVTCISPVKRMLCVQKTHTHAFTHTQAHTYAWTNRHTHTDTHTHTRTHTYVQICLQLWRTMSQKRTYTNTHTHAHTHRHDLVFLTLFTYNVSPICSDRSRDKSALTISYIMPKEKMSFSCMNSL